MHRPHLIVLTPRPSRDLTAQRAVPGQQTHSTQHVQRDRVIPREQRRTRSRLAGRGAGRGRVPAGVGGVASRGLAPPGVPVEPNSRHAARAPSSSRCRPLRLPEAREGDPRPEGVRHRRRRPLTTVARDPVSRSAPCPSTPTGSKPEDEPETPPSRSLELHRAEPRPRPARSTDGCSPANSWARRAA